MKKKTFAVSASKWLVRAFAAAALLLAAPPVGVSGELDFAKPSKLIPIIFVHGGSGSGAQFESQAMRFESNGYPASHIAVLEYDSSAIGTILPDVLARLDALIAETLANTGATQVDLMGHSLGTFVSQTYLSTPARAAKVAHYVNMDGAPAAAPPGGVLALATSGIARAPLQRSATRRSVMAGAVAGSYLDVHFAFSDGRRPLDYFALVACFVLWQASYAALHHLTPWRALEARHATP